MKRLRMLVMLAMVWSAAICQAQESEEQMLTIKSEKMARTGKQWFKVETDITCHEQYPELQKSCSRLLFGKDYAQLMLTDAFDQYLKNTYEEVQDPGSIDRTLGQKEQMKVKFIGGKAGKYLNYRVDYLKAYNEGNETFEKKRERHIVYDVMHQKVLSMADIFQPEMIESVKEQLKMGKSTPQMELSDDGLTVGTIKNGKFVGDMYKFANQSDDVFTEQFKQLIGFAAIKVEKHKNDSILLAARFEENRLQAIARRQRDSLDAIANLEEFKKHVVTIGNNDQQLLTIYDKLVENNFVWFDNFILTDVRYDNNSSCSYIDLIDQTGCNLSICVNGQPVSMGFCEIPQKMYFNYPKEAYKEEIEGTVVVEFVVEKDGSKSGVKVVKSLCPSLDEMALNIAKRLKTRNASICNQPIRKRCQIAFTFTTHDKNVLDHDLFLTDLDLGDNLGKIICETDFDIDKGISSRITMGMVVSRTRTSRYGSNASLKHSSIDVDIPTDKNFEELLSKLVFGKGGSSMRKVAKSVSKSIYDMTSGRKDMFISGRCLAIIPDKIISYGCHSLITEGYNKDNTHPLFLALSSNNQKTKRKSSGNNQKENKTSSFNVIYSIQQQRLLTVADMLTSAEISKAGISPNAQIGMDSLFLYVEKNEAWPVIYALSRDNWDKFAPVLQGILGNNRESLPQFSTDDYELGNFYGVQAQNVNMRFVSPAGYVGGLDALKTRLASQLKVDDALLNEHSSVIALLVDANGKATVVGAKTLSGSEQMTDRLKAVLEDSEGWQPTTLAKQKQPALLMYELMGSVAKSGETADQHLQRIAQVSASASDASSGKQWTGKVFDVVDQMPEFPGGQEALKQWISDHIKYPAVAEENGIQGRVVCTFVVERDGSITDVKVIRSIDPSLDKEAVRVVKQMPRWIPGKQKGKPVRVKYTVPVIFYLQ